MLRKESDFGEEEGVKCEGVRGEEGGVFQIIEYPQSPQRLRKCDPLAAVEGGMGEGEGVRGVNEQVNEEKKEKDEEEEEGEEEENSVNDEEGTTV